jgi:glutathione S-transferase
VITLYVDSGYFSPYALSAFAAASEKGIVFSVQTIDLGRPTAARGETFARDSLTSRVPALVHDGFTLVESSAIAEYIDECFDGPRLYPEDRQSRARARMVQAWIRSDLLALRKARSTHGVFGGFGTVEPLGAEARSAADKLITTANALLSNGGGYVAGTWSIADIDLAMMLMRLVASGEPVADALQHYARQQWSRVSVQRWLAAGGHVNPQI